MAHQHGFTETSRRSAPVHAGSVGILRRYCEEVVTFFDADAAGQKAAERAAELLEPSEAGSAWAVNRAGAFETGGPSASRSRCSRRIRPDTFLREHGAAGFTERIAAARSLLGYALDRTIADPEGGTGPALAPTRSPGPRDAGQGDRRRGGAALSREAATKLGVDATQLWIESQKLQSALRKPSAVLSRPATVERERAQDRALVRLLLQHVPPDYTASITDDADLISPHSARSSPPCERVPTARPRASWSTSMMLSVAAHGPPPRGRTIGSRRPDVSIAGFRRRLEREHHLRRQQPIAQSIKHTQRRTSVLDTPVQDFQALHRRASVV